FDDAAFERIHAITDGIPRRINGLCDRLLLSCYLAAGHQIADSLVQSVAEELSAELEPERTAQPEPPRQQAVVTGALPDPARLARWSKLEMSARRGLLAAEYPALADRRVELEERVAWLESRQHTLQTRIKRLLRQS